MTRFLFLKIKVNILKFKKIELSDVQKIKEFTHNNEILACEKNVANLVIWQRAYNNMYAIKDGILFLKSGKEKTQSFSVPIGGDIKKGLTLCEKVRPTNGIVRYLVKNGADERT